MIEFRNVSKNYSENKVLHRINLKANEGETLVLLGESGCGKTTTLKMINKLIIPTEGEIFIDNTNIKKFNNTELRRNIGYVIQDKGLFPHYTVRENIKILPTLLKWDKKLVADKVDEMLKLVDLDVNSFQSRYPHELSGGQQQRVSIARALITNPGIVLMDEPFGALDNITRKQVRSQFKKIENLLSKTIVLVTHDISEAFELGDKICLMNEGEIVQYGTPFELLFEPQNDYVSNFFKHDKLLNEFQLIKVEQIIDYISSAPAHQSAFVAITTGDSVQKVLDIISNDLNSKKFHIKDINGTTIKECSADDLISGFFAFKEAYQNNKLPK